MANENHYNFLKKVALYPIINEAVERVPQCYRWLKSQNQILNVTLTKAETVITTIVYTTEPFVESRLKSIDNVLCNQLEKMEKMIPPIIGKPMVILEESYQNIYVKNIQPTIGRSYQSAKNLPTHIKRLTNTFLLRLPSTLDIDNFICDMLERVFDKFIPDPDETETVSRPISYDHLQPKDPSPKELISLSQLTISEVEKHCDLNNDILGRLQFLSSETNGEMDESLIKEFLHSVLRYYRKLEKFLLKFAILPPDNLTNDMNVSLDFLNKNLRRLEMLLDVCQSDPVNNEFVFQFNFVLDQIQSGLYSLIYNLRNHIEHPQELSGPVSEIMSDFSSRPDDED